MNRCNEPSKPMRIPRGRAPNARAYDGEREAIVSFEDPSLPHPHWGISYRGPQYAPLFARWFDEIWQSPASYAVFSRDGVHKQELDRIRLRLEALSAIDRSAPASRRN